MKKGDKISVSGIVLKRKFRIFFWLLVMIGGSAGVSDDYKVWVKADKGDRIFKINTEYKLKIGEQVKVLVDPKNPKRCMLDGEWYWKKISKTTNV